MRSNFKYLFIIVFIVIFILIFFISFYIKGVNIPKVPIFIDSQVSPTPLLLKEHPEKDIIRCPSDVKKCLNGSYVGRIGPSCSFAQCPK